MSNSTWIKICGLTRPDDVVNAIDAGADAIGVILVARSARCIDVPAAAELALVAAGAADVVALVEGDVNTAIASAERVGADAVQPYGPGATEIALAALEAGLGVYMPVPVDGGGPIDLSELPPGARPLLDSAEGGHSGGTGLAFNWALARPIAGAVIAGGLNPDNVAGAIAIARPWGVDASSGLEESVGHKDNGKVRSFIEAVRSA